MAEALRERDASNAAVVAEVAEVVVAGSFISILEVGWWKRDVSGACCLETDERARREEDQVLEAGYRGRSRASGVC